jgi:ribosomal protein S12 methylthiotransferase
MIVGHPGETNQHFEDLLDFVEKSRFERLGVFTYSHEENTHAHSMDDVISEEEKQERLERVMEVQQGISLELNQQKVGKTFKVLIDRKEGGQYIGRTEFDSPEVDNEVLVSSPEEYLRTGDFADVKIESATEFDLSGVVMTNA